MGLVAVRCVCFHIPEPAAATPTPTGPRDRAHGLEPKPSEKAKCGTCPPTLPARTRKADSAPPPPHPAFDNLRPCLALPLASCSSAVGQGGVRAGARPRDPPPSHSLGQRPQC